MSDADTTDGKKSNLPRLGRCVAFGSDFGGGMSERTYIATACLQGLLAAPYTDQLNRDLAADAVMLADALLTELAK